MCIIHTSVIVSVVTTLLTDATCLCLLGYIDEAGFRQMMIAFQKRRGPLRPQVVFLDGFDAHFSAVLTVMKADGIWVFFLRAHNSVNDQGHDNGPNAVYEGWCNLALEQVRQRNPVFRSLRMMSIGVLRKRVCI